MGGAFSIWHWLVVGIVLMMIFGPKRLAAAGQGLGEGLKALREGLKDDEEKRPSEQAPSNKESSKES